MNWSGCSCSTSRPCRSGRSPRTPSCPCGSGELAAADALLIVDYGATTDPAAGPTFQALPAAAAGRVVRLTRDQSFAVMQPNPLAPKLDLAVDVIAQLIAITRP